jgi:hypothetical protein
MPYVVPSMAGDFRRAEEIITVTETMHDRVNSWMVVGMHGVGTGTHNNFIDAEEHRYLIDWIADQRSWLEAVTMLEAAHRHLRHAACDPAH